MAFARLGRFSSAVRAPSSDFILGIVINMLEKLTFVSCELRGTTMNMNWIRGAVVALTALGASVATASPIPSVTDSYQGSYDLSNADTNHGLWLKNLYSGVDKTWSISSGKAVYVGNTLTLNGTVTNNGGALSLDFSFLLTEKPGHSGPLQCGNAGCPGVTQQMKDNIVYFDEGTNPTQGTIKGTSGSVLEGLLLDVTMVPTNGTKPGQLGYGGNWFDNAFGYSNWFAWTVVSQADNSNWVTKNNGGSHNGDINVTMLANGDTINQTPIPLPAGLPLLLAGLGAFGLARRFSRG